MIMAATSSLTALPDPPPPSVEFDFTGILFYTSPQEGAFRQGIERFFGGTYYRATGVHRRNDAFLACCSAAALRTTVRKVDTMDPGDIFIDERNSFFQADLFVRQGGVEPCRAFPSPIPGACETCDHRREAVRTDPGGRIHWIHTYRAEQKRCPWNGP